MSDRSKLNEALVDGFKRAVKAKGAWKSKVRDLAIAGRYVQESLKQRTGVARKGSPNDRLLPPCLLGPPVLTTDFRRILSLDLSSNEKVTDASIKSTLVACPAIEELFIYETKATIAAIQALKSHRPLKFLGLGGGCSDSRLFDTDQVQPALCELFSTRGASLTRFRVGECAWQMSPELPNVLAESVARLRVLHVIGHNDGDALLELIDGLPALRDLAIETPFEDEFEYLEARAPERVRMHCLYEFQRSLAVGECWNRFAGATTP
ncbi:hypothetical protein BDK51DRAFT_26885 [Blyttiomyces helicus]|uniref:F-box domain-containing protein n=1 Tax=Blyttiomyces helicus TaxID=388810 RepID=A0A4P9W8A3_9FUNG|nr:hypothetical protein BDK51DRAFT_26885 [Blyttiomyces helicus]|eukprot:RKO87665.1 hypothetical protein BDK51DRAFT_26885 [Blyttiomyces helicus]